MAGANGNGDNGYAAMYSGGTPGPTVPEPKTEAKAEELLTGQPLTLGYKPTVPMLSFWGEGGVPVAFSTIWRDIELMLIHPHVHLPLSYYKAGVANVEFEVKAQNPEVQHFVEEQLRRFWERSLDQVQHGYDYGWGGYEISYSLEKGYLTFHSLYDLHPLDVWALTRRGEFVGISVHNVSGIDYRGALNLWGPRHWPAKGFWFTHNRKYHRWYGRSQLYAAWRPWRRLAFRDGAEEVIDGGVYRFAYGGWEVRYPPEDFQKQGGGIDFSAARNRAREFTETAKAGVGIALPNSWNSEAGDYKWTINKPDQVLNVDPLVNYIKYLKDEIAYGVGVPPELLEAAETGSGYSGRKIPLLGFYAGQMRNARNIVTAWKWQIGDPLVRWNFGRGQSYTIEVKLVLPADLAGGDNQGQGAPKGPQPPGGPQQPGAEGGLLSPQQAASGLQSHAEQAPHMQGGGGAPAPAKKPVAGGGGWSQQSGKRGGTVWYNRRTGKKTYRRPTTLSTVDDSEWEETESEWPPVELSLDDSGEGREPPSPDLAAKDAERILDEAMGAFERVTRRAKRELFAALAKGPLSAALAKARKILDTLRPELVSLISDTQLASVLGGMAKVARRVKSVAQEAGQPTPEQLQPSWFGDETEGAIEKPSVALPVIEEAVRDLRSRQLLTASQYDQLAGDARSKAFEVAGVESEALLGKIRDAVADAVEKGQTLSEFTQNLEAATGEANILAPAHAETVFRRYVQEGYSNGQDKLLEHPVVDELFPYAAVFAVNDDRVREEHLAMETRGIQGTNIYRRDDPVFQLFKGPWDWNCRCGWTALSLRDAANKGIEEAAKWLETGLAPLHPAFVEMPPWRPSGSFTRPVEMNLTDAEGHLHGEDGRFVSKGGGGTATATEEPKPKKLKGRARHRAAMRQLAASVEEMHRTPEGRETLARGEVIARKTREKLRAGVEAAIKSADQKSTGGISLIAGGLASGDVHAVFHGADQLFGAVFRCVHQEIFKSALAHHSVAGAHAVGQVASALAAKTEQELLKAVAWALRKMRHEDTDRTLSLAEADLTEGDRELLRALADLARQTIADLCTEVGVAPPDVDTDRLARRILKKLGGGEAELSTATDASEGRWITIGGAKGEDGKHHGGSPVFIKDGKIVKGAPSLAGKKLDNLRGESESTHRQELHREKDYARATYAKQAKKEGIDPEDLHRLAAEMQAHDKAHVEQRKALLKDARGTLAANGYDARALTTNLRSGRVEDKIPGFDELTDEMAKRYPDQFSGHGDPEARMIDLLTEGNPQPMTEEDAYGHALEHLKGQKAAAEEEFDFPSGKVFEDELEEEGDPWTTFATDTESGGHWITIAGHADEEKGTKHSGGVHVYVEGGKITKGPAALAGKSLGELSKSHGVTAIHGENHPETGTPEGPKAAEEKPAAPETKETSRPARFAIPGKAGLEFDKGTFDPEKSYAVNGKEPWEMTANEWEDAFDAARSDPSGQGGGVGRKSSRPTHGGASRTNKAIETHDRLKMGLGHVVDPDGIMAPRPARHEQVVQAALAAGKKVPEKVLAEYPDLAPKTAEPLAPQAAEPEGDENELGSPRHIQNLKEAIAEQQELAREYRAQAKKAAKRGDHEEAQQLTSDAERAERRDDLRAMLELSEQEAQAKRGKTKADEPPPAPAEEKPAVEPSVEGGEKPEETPPQEPKYEYAKVTSIDTPWQGNLLSARARRKAAHEQIKRLQRQIKSEPIGGARPRLMLELAKAKSRHADEMGAERIALSAIERRANELGKTTRKPL